MKKSFIAVAITLLSVLAITACITFFIDWGNSQRKAYSQTTDLTSCVTEDMSVNDIATLYNDSCVTVYVPGASMGSGVCVAASGYQTQNRYKAKKGAYIATNYHVIAAAVERDYEGAYSASIILNGGDYSSRKVAQVLWYDKDVDMALLYCDQDLAAEKANFGYITMKDRSVACTPQDRLIYDEIFTIGTPLNLTYQNTFSKGYVSNMNPQTSFTTKPLYLLNTGAYTTNGKYSSSALKTMSIVDNVYQKLIMMNLDIASGNSGGGVFDENGYIVGLSTLSISYTEANTAAMNFAVPIYPLTLVLDRIIRYNEQDSSDKNIYSMSDIGLYALDEDEIKFLKQLRTTTGGNLVNNSYYIDGKLFNINAFDQTFRFVGVGMIVLESSSLTKNIQKDFVITKIDDKIVYDKNDLIYALYSHIKGDTVKLGGYQVDTPAVVREYSITL